MCKLTFHGHEAAVSCLHFDESRIISGALDRLIKIWNLVTGEVMSQLWISYVHVHFCTDSVFAPLTGYALRGTQE